jgi:hypothetical protein
MRPTEESRECASLRKCWRQWAEIVELFARRRSTRGVVTPHEYQALHRDLIAVCRALAGTAEESKREFYQELENLVQPWLALHVLEQTPREILFNLLARCQLVEQVLGCRTWVNTLRRWALPLCALLAVGAGITLLVRNPDQVVYPVLDWGRDYWRVVCFALRRSSAFQQWAAAGIIAIAIAVFLMTRTARH